MSPLAEAVFPAASSVSVGSVASGMASVAQKPSRAQRVLQSQQLFGIGNEVLIEHAGFTYRLRITQANKLILTK
ncbi:MAG: hemin uptake protein HemP [Steroidobacteraceae bacterium]